MDKLTKRRYYSKFSSVQFISVYLHLDIVFTLYIGTQVNEKEIPKPKSPPLCDKWE